jgi:hypothetical protein
MHADFRGDVSCSRLFIAPLISLLAVDSKAAASEYPTIGAAIELECGEAESSRLTYQVTGTIRLMRRLPK